MQNLWKLVFGDGGADHVFEHTIYQKYNVLRTREASFPEHHLCVCTKACAHMDRTRQIFEATPYIQTPQIQDS